MHPTTVPVEEFLATVPERRRTEAAELIPLFREVTGQDPVMWGPSIIGFGSVPYRNEGGAEGVQPAAAFSPRTSACTLYLSPTVLADAYLMSRLGPHRAGRSCLYLTRPSNADPEVLREVITRSLWELVPPERTRTGAIAKVRLRCVTDYLASVPFPARPKLDELRDLVRSVAPDVMEFVSYGLVGYRLPGGGKAAKLFVSGWQDHVAMYPQPSDKALRAELAPWIRGKGTLWFALDEDLPTDLLRRTAASLLGPKSGGEGP